MAQLPEIYAEPYSEVTSNYMSDDEDIISQYEVKPNSKPRKGDLKFYNHSTTLNFDFIFLFLKWVMWHVATLVHSKHGQ